MASILGIYGLIGDPVGDDDVEGTSRRLARATSIWRKGLQGFFLAKSTDVVKGDNILLNDNILLLSMFFVSAFVVFCTLLFVIRDIVVDVFISLVARSERGCLFKKVRLVSINMLKMKITYLFLEQL